MIQMTREVNGNADKKWPLSPSDQEQAKASNKNMT